jgi:hypothetical protein
MMDTKSTQLFNLIEKRVKRGMRMLMYTISEFKSRIDDCLHSKTLSRMLQPFDTQNLIVPAIVSG